MFDTLGLTGTVRVHFTLDLPCQSAGTLTASPVIVIVQSPGDVSAYT